MRLTDWGQVTLPSPDLPSEMGAHSGAEERQFLKDPRFPGPPSAISTRPHTSGRLWDAVVGDASDEEFTAP